MDKCSNVVDEGDDVVDAAAAWGSSSGGGEEWVDDLAELGVDNILVDVDVLDPLVVLDGVGNVFEGGVVWDHGGLGLVGEHDSNHADENHELLEHFCLFVY